MLTPAARLAAAETDQLWLAHVGRQRASVGYDDWGFASIPAIEPLPEHAAAVAEHRAASAAVYIIAETA